ncbi:hypothetical protein [Flavihumibacter sp. ZG627]|uniref:hypothetical protein n=1 Tax=Flavihumibacter sp. ZG627 TaxID=1463156 RepID=UPI00057D9A5E|nr:hypothetical protein [Flavihumibacter sp. ZG627]KIC90934.1 hypothetical protein HY58_07825 [Flavihumibacter sp. ZG627]
METDKRYCLWCNALLKGRIDKKFCDDSCRNAFNNRRTGDEYNQVRNINHALVRNRRILATTLASGEDSKKVSREILLEQGFQFKYFTQYLSNDPLGPLCFCYDYGYIPLPDEYYLVVRKK